MLIAEIGLNHLGYAYQAKEYIKIKLDQQG